MCAETTTGTLERYPLPRLFCFLEQKSFTGLLHVETSPAPTEVLFNDGIPVGLFPQAVQALTRLLLERGRLAFEQYAELMTSLSSVGATEDNLLHELAGVTPEELTKGRRYLLFKDLCRLFQTREGPFSLSAEQDPRIASQAASGVAIEPLYLVYNGIRNSYDEGRLRGELEPIETQALTMKAGTEDVLARFGFGDEEGPAVRNLQLGYWTLPDLITATGGEPLPVLMLVYALWSAGVLDAADPGVVPCMRPKRADPGPTTEPGAGGEAPAQRVSPPPAQEQKISAGVSGERLNKPSPRPAGSAPPTPPPTPLPPPTPGATPPPTPRPKVGMDGFVESGTHRQRRRTDHTPRSGAYATARISAIDVRRAKLAAQRVREGSKLKPEARAVLDELIDRFGKMDGQSPFDLLSVSLEAKTVDVKNAYLQLVKRLHPDRLASIGLQEMTDVADDLFKRITQAHQTLLDPDQLEEARRIFSGDATADDPEAARRAIEAEVNFRKAEVFFRKGDLAQAEEHFRLSVEGNPEEGEHLAMLAWIRYQRIPKDERQRRRAQIMKMMVSAIELSPRCARAHYFLGKLHQEDSNTSSALESFKRATQMKPDYIEAMREVRLITMRNERESKTKRKSTLLDMLSLKRKRK
ncbi:MAG: DUF4388 domain-containing protein [bacterium]